MSTKEFTPIANPDVLTRTQTETGLRFARGVYLNIFQKMENSDIKFKIAHIDYGTYGWYSLDEMFLLDQNLAEIDIG